MLLGEQNNLELYFFICKSSLLIYQDYCFTYFDDAIRYAESAFVSYII